MQYFSVYNFDLNCTEFYGRLLRNVSIQAVDCKSCSLLQSGEMIFRQITMYIQRNNNWIFHSLNTQPDIGRFFICLTLVMNKKVEQ